MLTTGPHLRFLERHIGKTVRPPIVQAIKAYRLATRHLRVLPDFVIIGARKCGTTSLYEYLMQHSQVLPALSKELYYFDYHHAQGVNWYRSHFPTRIEKWGYEKALGQPVITGEATPSYFYHPITAHRIAKLLPRVKLILLLREPIEAAYSAYQFGLKLGTYTAKDIVFEKLIQTELDYVNQGGELFERKDGTISINPKCSLLARHAYIELLEPWFEVFDQRQIKVVLSEDLFSVPGQVYREVQEFLGLPIRELGSYKSFNENSYHKLEIRKAAPLQRFFAPFNDRLSRFLGRNVNWDYSKDISKGAESGKQAGLLTL